MLSQKEIDLFEKWIAEDCPEGDTKLCPSPPEFPEGSQLGHPDLVLKFSKPFLIEGNNKDNFMMMKIPYELPSDTFIKTIEIIPKIKTCSSYKCSSCSIQFRSKENLNNGEFVVNTELMDKRDAFAKLDLANDDGSYPMLTFRHQFSSGVETALYPNGMSGYHVKDGILF